MPLPDDYKLSESENLAPLVRDFCDMKSAPLTDEELLALDFALEWVTSTLKQQFNFDIEDEYGVIYGVLPKLRTIIVGTLEDAQRVAASLNGQVCVRHKTRWERYVG